ncbi:hypothetical protein BIFDEN_02147 [Bifidobacterium dentium ATCC 27678]|nr:hypothetical protein BIFDEN_02147 [Bifidobacterium dentium ATCC 27678]
MAAAKHHHIGPILPFFTDRSSVLQRRTYVTTNRLCSSTTKFGLG